MPVTRCTEEQARTWLSQWAQANWSKSEAARMFGGSEKLWRDRISLAKNKCPDSGVVPTDVPKGLRFSKTTVQYDQHGNVINEWRRLQGGIEDPEETAKRLVKLCGGKSPRLASLKSVAGNGSGRCLVIPIYDLHIGKYAWAKETGEDYDLEIVRKLIVNTAKIAVSRSGPVEKILLVGGGDWYHADGRVPQTERSGHVLDVDSRAEKVRDVSLEAIHQAISICSSQSKSMDVCFIPGNHDHNSAFWTARVLDAFYSRSSHIHVYRSPKTRQYFQWGTTLIGLDHGMMKMHNYLSLMPSEVPLMWSTSTERLWLLGHIHQQKVIQQHGVTVEHLESLSAADAWHYQAGYVGNPRRTVTFLLDKDYGMLNRNYITAKEALE